VVVTPAVKMGGDGTTQVARPKIAAMERGKFACNCTAIVPFFFSFSAGPGPARYALRPLTGGVSHCNSKKLYPAYSFGKRLGTSCKLLTVIYKLFD